MGYYTTAEIVKIVNKLIDRCGTRDPYKMCIRDSNIRSFFMG